MGTRTLILYEIKFLSACILLKDNTCHCKTLNFILMKLSYKPFFYLDTVTPAKSSQKEKQQKEKPQKKKRRKQGKEGR